MPTPGAERPIQRVPSGLSGPGGIGFWPAAHGELGGYHHGFFHLTTIVKRPSGVGYWLWPVATMKNRQYFIPLYRSRRFELRRMTITGPKFRRVTFGFSAFVASRISSRVPAASAALMSWTAWR